MTAALLSLLLALPVPARAAETKPAVSAKKKAASHGRKARAAKATAKPAAKPEAVSTVVIVGPKPEAKPAAKPAPVSSIVIVGPQPEPKPAPVAASTHEVIIPVLDVVWPVEADKFPYLTRSFTFGHTNPGAKLTVNGQPLQVRPSGAFFAMVPFSTGTFALDFQETFSGLTVSTSRVVEVAPRFGPQPEPGTVLALEPSEDAEMMPGELLTVRCKGAPGGEGTFSLGRIAKNLPMAESSTTAPGLYEGQLYLPLTDRHDPQEVRCRVRGDGGGKATAPGKVTVLDPRQTRVAVVNVRQAIMKSEEGGYTYFPPKGTRVEVI
ncbi:MAG: hypothetical protein KGL53_14190, partial [Elusimicrobia bacterium]|nr:hypothetical protein [Elusimicrobiota bacterium]